jgi:hypothetical protein
MKFLVGDIPYQLANGQVIRLPFERNHRCYVQKIVARTADNKYILNGIKYSIEEITQKLIK